MNKLKDLITLILVISFCIFYCGKEEKKAENVVVQVGSESLTLSMLKKVTPIEDNIFLVHEQVQNYIQMWIDQELMSQEAIRLGMDKDQGLQDALKKAKKDYLVNKLLDSLMSESISIPEQELINYYELNKENFVRTATEIKALHILVNDIREANEARRRILLGEDFEEVAKEVSIDFEKKGRVDTGYFTAEDVVPEIALSLFRYRTGSLTRPIKSEFGYHIFKIIDKKGADEIREFNEVRDIIIERLLAKKKEEKYKEYITNLKGRLEVDTNFDLLKELYDDGENIAPKVLNDSL